MKREVRTIVSKKQLLLSLEDLRNESIHSIDNEYLETLNYKDVSEIHRIMIRLMELLKR